MGLFNKQNNVPRAFELQILHSFSFTLGRNSMLRSCRQVQLVGGLGVEPTTQRRDYISHLATKQLCFGRNVWTQNNPPQIDESTGFKLTDGLMGNRQVNNSL